MVRFATLATLNFQWDPTKAVINIAKHGVTFHEAKSVFDDLNGATGYDPQHSDDEDRFITVGISNQGRLLIVWHTDRDEDIRLMVLGTF